MSVQVQLQSIGSTDDSNGLQERSQRFVNAQNVEDALAAFSKGQVLGEFFPSCYGIEVTRQCNLACVMCPHPNFMPDEKGHMDMNLFQEIIGKISPYAELVKLHWIGEPLLHPKIVEMIRCARAKLSASIILSTNASFLQGDLSEGIRTAGLDKIILSLDGMSKASYEAVRINGNFGRVYENIEAFVELVERNGGPLCEVQMIATKFNRHEVALFRQKWSNYKNVAVNVTWLTDWAGNIPDRDTVSESRNPISLSYRKPCSDLWFKLQISWTGEVNLCCLDARGSVMLGKVQQQTLRELWQSPMIAELRRQHLHKQYQGICNKCTDWAQPQEYEFWYSQREYQEDPSAIWSAPPV